MEGQEQSLRLFLSGLHSSDLYNYFSKPMTTNIINGNSATENLICPLPFFQKLTIEGKDQPTYQDHLQVIGVMPDLVLKAHGVSSIGLYECNLGKILDDHRAAFKAMKLWLERAYEVDNEYIPDLPELHQNWVSDYKVMAEELLALLHLCKEILQRDPMGWNNGLENKVEKKLEKPTATMLWFGVIYERLERSLRSTGVLDKGEQQSKQATCDQMSKQIRNNYKTLGQRQFFQNRSDIDRLGIKIVECAEDAVLIHADFIAKQDYDFCEEIYKDYQKTKSRAIRSIRNNPNFQFVWLEANGSLRVGGKGKRGKGKKG